MSHRPLRPPAAYNLTAEEIKEEQLEAAFRKEHAGHGTQHLFMFIILFGGLISSHALTTWWKRKYPQSYNLVTLIGLWLVPAILGGQAGNWRFICTWLLFSFINTWIIYAAVRGAVSPQTPKLVYRWFLSTHNVCQAAGLVSYVLIGGAFLRIPSLLRVGVGREPAIFAFGLDLAFYALYFGTLGRDCVDRLADRMAAKIGYYSKSGLPAKHLRSSICAICGESTGQGEQKFHRLICNHTYHDLCIRGWLILGKKDMCPYCKEKVDTRAFQKNPWDITQRFYLNILDAVRYLVVWNPIAMVLIHLVITIFRLK